VKYRQKETIRDSDTLLRRKEKVIRIEKGKKERERDCVCVCVCVCVCACVCVCVEKEREREGERDDVMMRSSKISTPKHVFTLVKLAGKECYKSE
jgi:hypothetical protein